MRRDDAEPTGRDRDEGIIPPKKRPRYAGVHGSIRASAHEIAEAEREGREVEFVPEHHANPWTDYDFPKGEDTPPKKRPPREGAD